MRRSIDLKSVLIGGLLAMVVICAMGGVPRIDPDYNGRFAIVPAHTPGASAYVLDTATGQVWSQHRSRSDEFYAPKLLQPQDADEPPVEPARQRP